ncbi:hypothetical protein GCM10023231_35870 [Olivibacter ginsenosidimutans]|uniref:LysM domain-containing protein n=1 Tax=Olivibacter ginsenosidimutans TaxID=1176537 RepID=A0ABP9C6B6_9SPHI
MGLKRFSAFAVGVLFCAQLAQAVTHEGTDDLLAKDGEATLSKEDSSIRKEVPIKDLSWYLAPHNIKQQLDTLQKAVPLTYNNYVQSYIEAYASPRYRNHLSKMLGLAQYYFPIYEKVFAETNLPQEIKYLSIIESALNPHAVSRVGATGPWQFMFATAKAFNLNMDNYVDERKDPYAATYAAAAYLKEAYDEFGDWQLAIASYNCGKGNVERAIQRSGLAKPDFWSVRQYLPQETRNYVPAYIAMTYVLSNSAALRLTPNAEHVFISENGTDAILIDKFVSLASVAEALNIDISQLSALNPAYKKNIINGTPESPKRLILPAVDKTAYASLYAVLNTNTEAPVQVMTASTKISEKPIYHLVKRGESLGSVASRYRVEIQDLKAWNNLKRNMIVPGQRLKIEGQVSSAPTKASRKTTTIQYATYRVKRGDTLSRIAQKYKGVTVSSLKAMNNLKGQTIKPGMTLKVNRL